MWASTSRCSHGRGHFVLDVEPANPLVPMCAGSHLSLHSDATPVGG
jgi:hypothetical protein